jgi:hypothetical protein
VQSNQGRAEYERAVQEASRIRAIAEAEADKVRRMAEAEAERAARVGVAEAVAIEEQVRAYGGPKLQLTQKVLTRFSEAIEKSGVEVVPRVVVGGVSAGQAGGGGQGVLEALLAMLMSDRTGDVTSAAAAPPAETAQRIRDELKKTLGRASNGGAAS